jgi:hypothetical protein
MNIMFSPLGTGSCPLCKKFANCHILRAVQDLLLSEVRPVHDDKVEVEMVFYACPEFEE